MLKQPVDKFYVVDIVQTGPHPSNAYTFCVWDRRNLALQYFRPAIIVLRMHMVHGTGYGAQDEEEASSEKFLATSRTHRHIQVPSESKLRSARDMGNYCGQTSAFRAL